jgi:hypothetical protein
MDVYEKLSPHEKYALSVWSEIILYSCEEIGSEDWDEASIKLRAAASLLSLQGLEDEAGDLILLSRIADRLSSITPPISDSEWAYRTEDPPEEGTTGLAIDNENHG